VRRRPREALGAQHAGLDRLAAGRHLVQAADVHLAILGERQGARDRRRGHDQQVRRPLGLGGQHHALGDAEAMLLVDDGEAEPAILDSLLEDRMRADQMSIVPAASPIRVASRRGPFRAR
jgi:hypothetical protein